MDCKALAGALVLGLAGCATGPAEPPDPAAAQTACGYPAFVDQRPYYSGALVRHAGKLYRAKYDHPGYIPNVSTYFWTEVTPFVAHRRYYEGDVVAYQGQVYLAAHDNPAYLPNVSTYFWTLLNCPR